MPTFIHSCIFTCIHTCIHANIHIHTCPAPPQVGEVVQTPSSSENYGQLIVLNHLHYCCNTHRDRPIAPRRGDGIVAAN